MSNLVPNIKLTSYDWETSGIWDISKGKKQRDINAELYNRVIRTTASIGVPTSGSTDTHYLPGLTSNHEVVAWNISISGVKYADNASPFSLTIETFSADNQATPPVPAHFTVTNNGGPDIIASMRPVFALPTTIEELTVT